MDLLELSHKRYTTKVYDNTKSIPAEVVEQLLDALRFSASSVNSQPWHFIAVSSEEGKKRLAAAVGDEYAFNQKKILDASLTVVFASRLSLSDEYLARLLEQEEKDGRFADAEAKAGQAKGRSYFVGLHREAGDVAEWTARQTYIALGTGLLGAAALGLDATPIEGYNAAGVDTEYGLADKGLRSLVLMSVGYHGNDDFNAKLPKSRLSADEVITRL